VREINSSNFAIIAGLPRSGTAWLAAALNMHPEIFAFHEAAETDQSYMGRVTEKAQYFYHVVDCTTVTLPSFDGVPATRIWIDRDPAHCRRSLTKIFGAERVDLFWDHMVQMGEEWKDRHQPQVFTFDDLMGGRCVHTVRAIAEAVGVHHPRRISESKMDQLRALNVQIHGLNPEYYADRPAQTTP
jgi:hypothetical protein